MPATIMSSREFDRDASRARRLTESGPVFITDTGSSSQVLLTIDAYEALTGGGRSIADLLAMPGMEDIEFDPPRSTSLHRPADLG